MKIVTSCNRYSKFSPQHTIEVVSHIKARLVNQNLNKILTTKIDLDISQISEKSYLSVLQRDKLGWMGPFVLNVGEEFLFVQFDGYFCHKIELSSDDIDEIVNIENIPIKEINSSDDKAFIDISFLYPDIVGHKVTDIYTEMTFDNASLLALIIVIDNKYYVAIGNDIDNPRMGVFSDKKAMEKAIKFWSQQL